MSEGRHLLVCDRGQVTIFHQIVNLTQLKVKEKTSSALRRIFFLLPQPHDISLNKQFKIAFACEASKVNNVVENSEFPLNIFW